MTYRMGVFNIRGGCGGYIWRRVVTEVLPGKIYAKVADYCVAAKELKLRYHNGYIGYTGYRVEGYHNGHIS